MTHFGDRQGLFSSENQAMVETPLIERPWRYCSIFSSGNENHMIVGRNWDNENVGSIIVNLYRPEKGYSSISFSRSIDMNFPINIDLVSIRTHPMAKGLLLAPFYSFDGINEQGLVVGVAGVRQVAVRPRQGKELTYVPLLVRKLLDQTKNLEEAVELVERHIPFDLDQHSLNTHFFVADSSGKSVILEYVDDGWNKFYSEKSWQVLENRPIHDVTDEELRAQSWRYRKMSEALEQAETGAGWQDGLQILENVSQKGTSWSVIYSPTAKELYFSVYQKWDVVYHLKMP
jgi:choloylglycine hydrolase